MEYRIQRLKEDLTLAQQRNKRQRKQLANYTKAYKNKCNECNEYKQALNEIRKYINNKQIGEEHFGNEPYMFETKYGKDILKIIDKTLRGEN